LTQIPCSKILILDKIISGVALKHIKFFRIHSAKTQLYGQQTKREPISVDDEEFLAELFAFSATLTPLT